MSEASASRTIPVSVLARRNLRDVRGRTIVFAYIFAIYACVQPIGFRKTYPSALDRARFAESFAGNPGLRILYGRPHDIGTTIGYTEWRVGGVLAIVAAVMGLFLAVRVLRGEEETGRTEFLLTAPLSRLTVLVSSGLAVFYSIVILSVAELAGLLIGGIPWAGATLMSLAAACAAGLGAGIGAVTSQLASTARSALSIGAAVVAGTFLLRALSDTADGLRWLVWLTPLGWVEELRPLTDVTAWVFVLLIAVVTSLVAVTLRLVLMRDIGTGLLPDHDRAAPRLTMMKTPLRQNVRAQTPVIVLWLTSVGLFMFILGVVSHSISSTDIPAGVQRQIDKLGTGSLSSTKGYLAFLFLFLMVVMCLLACGQIGALSKDEIAYLETVLALPVGRGRWLSGRLLVSLCVVVFVAMFAGIATWLGTEIAGSHVGFTSLFLAGVNILPVTCLFLGLGFMLFGGLPRQATGVLYVLVGLSFLWQLVGALLSPPHWVLDLSPFAYVASAPSQDIRVLPAIVMLLVGASAASTGFVLFRRRDLLTG